MDNKEIVEYWINASDKDFDLAKELFNSGRYVYCLFFIHLSIEKLLKGLVVSNTGKPVPYEHNLVRLAEFSEVVFSDDNMDFLAEVTAFNIKGRYDDYKNQFYKIATKEYTSDYIDKSKELLQWLKTNLK